MKNLLNKIPEIKILIKGAGEVATAIAHKLSRAGFKICLTELSIPMAIHRGTSFSEAVWEKEKNVEGVTAILIESQLEMQQTWETGKIPVIVDPKQTIRDFLSFDVFIDATMPKTKTDIAKTLADLVIGIGPGFTAGEDVHIVIETNNTDRIGTYITKGKTDSDTKVPLEVGGYTFERVLRNKTPGTFKILRDMGSIIKKGETVGAVGDELLNAQISGCIRALMRNSIYVKAGTKLGEIDPRPEPELCNIMRPRMRNIAGGVLEAILFWYNR